MILEHTRMVTLENGPRPAGSPNECFYCGVTVGEEHREECVCWRRVVMVKVEMTIPMVVPNLQSASGVDFWLNESSWCADNIINELDSLLEARGADGPCLLCARFRGEYVREATAEDLAGIDLTALGVD